MDEANRLDPDEELSFTAKQCLKAFKCQQFSKQIRGQTLFFDCHCATHPIQIYLNETMAAERSQTTFTDAVRNGDADSVAAAETELLRRHFKFVSGSYGFDH